MNELVFGLPHNCKIGFIQFKDATKLFCIFDFVYGYALKTLFNSEEDAFRWLNLRKSNEIVHNQLKPSDDDDDDEVILCMDCAMANNPDYQFKTRASRSRMLITGLSYCAEEAFAEDSIEDVFCKNSRLLH